MQPKAFLSVFVILAILLISGACAKTPETGEGNNGRGSRLGVVATTTIVSDIVKQVAGDNIELTTLLPPGVDPHGYEPIPRDVAQVSDADLIFAHGAGLEEFLEKLIESAGAQDRVKYVSDGIQLLEPTWAIQEDAGEQHDHDRPIPRTLSSG